MSTPTLPTAEIDFAKNKEQLKTFLKNQTQLKDYNFDGSNLSVLLDVLSYNTYQNNFYLNQVFGEVFLDSARRRNSVVSHAKELGYTPTSATSATADVRLHITSNSEQSSTIVIPKNTIFTTVSGGKTYRFITMKNNIAKRVSGNLFSSDAITIYEGTLMSDFKSEGFYLKTSLPRCVLSNANVDISSISVWVNDETNVFTMAKDLSSVEVDSKVFYVEPYLDGKYSVYFGKNIFGEQPTSSDTIHINYRVCSGSSANGASRFTARLNVDNCVVETITRASGGSEHETLESIKINAPRSIQTQNRAVNESDYINLLKRQFPQIESVGVFGGEKLTPPKYGSVYVSVVLNNGDSVGDILKNDIVSYLSSKTPLTTKVVFSDTNILRTTTSLSVIYDKSTSTLTESEMEYQLRQILKDEGSTLRASFGSSMIASSVEQALSSVSASFTSITLIAKPTYVWEPTKTKVFNKTFVFGSPLVTSYPYNAAKGIDHYNPSFISSYFKTLGSCSYVMDIGNGEVALFSKTTNKIIKRRVGTIDYSKGIVSLSNFVADDYASGGIRFMGTPLSRDVVAPFDTLLNLTDSDITITFGTSP